MHTIAEIGTYTDVPILVRAALNVPLDGARVTNAYRLRRAAPTLRYLAERGARVIVISHIGEKGTETLEPVAAELAKLLPRVTFCRESVGPVARAAVRAMYPGDILVLENLRRHKGETANDPAFAAELASLADLYVDDSFDTCHRKHASIIGIPELLPAYAGLVVEEEVEALSSALHPSTPSLAVIGGAKFSTKEPVLRSLLTRYEHVFVGGALAHDFFVAQGHTVGKSLVSSDDLEGVRPLLTNPKLVLPVDALVVSASERTEPNARSRARVTTIDAIGADDVILDHGPATATLVANLAMRSTTTLWNGPLGNYELGFNDTTNALARAIAASGAHSVVGGGDTIAAIEKLGLFSKFSFVSTGGGAMLDFLTYGTLPGLQALR